MKRHPVLILAVSLISILLLASTVLSFAGKQADAPVVEFAAGRLLVKFGKAVSADAIQSIFARYGLKAVKEIPGLGVRVVAVPEGQEWALAKQLSRHPAVEYAEPDYIFHALLIPNDPSYATDQWNLPQINAPAAWDLTTGSADVVIALVDTGVDLGHPDLGSKVVAGYDFVNGDSNPQDDEGHGSHVAGIAAAVTNNGIGVAGISWGARIMPVKALDSDGSGYISDIADGIRWAADHGAHIINLSLGGAIDSSTLEAAVDYAYGRGLLLVAAAGNEYDEGSPIIYPAAYPHVVAVAATNDQDGHASYSNAGFYVDVAAPGGDPSSSADPNPRHWIMSTSWRGGGASYERHAGTSMATAHVTGLAALVWSQHPGWTNDDVKWAMESTAVDLGALGRDDLFGYGRIDARAAVALADLPPTPTPTPTPVCLAESAHPYANNTNQTWTVTNPDPAATHSRVHFSRLETETNYDFVIIKDGDGNEIQRLTGDYPSGIWSEPVPGRVVQIQLVTDSSVTDWGFCVDQIETTVPSTCLVESDHPYANNTNQTWTVTNPDPAAAASRVHFSRLETESNYDFVIIKDGAGSEVQRFTGNYSTGVWSDPVPGNVVQVQLTSDSSVTRWGFCLDQIETVAQPDIEVTPAAFSVTLPLGQTAQRTLTIRNTGQGTLNFNVTDVETTSGPGVTIHLPEGKVKALPAQVKTVGELRDRAAQKQEVPRGLTTQTAVRVLVVTPDEDISDLLAVLNSFPDIEAEVYTGSGAPDLSTLLPYDVVLTNDNRQWIPGGIDPVELGNVLADYIDAGGKVVVANYAYDYAQWAILGRFLTQDYGPFERATTDLDYPVTLGTFDAAHPIMQGVSTVEEDALHQDQTVAAGATLVASWDDDTPLVAAKPAVVGLNLLPSLGNGDHLWSGDVPTLLHNSIVWLTTAGADAPWLSEAPASGSVPAGGSQGITVTFDTVGLIAGTYTANIIVASNDPDESRVTVPATLTVEAIAPVTISVDPSPREVAVGEIFTLDLKIASGTQPVDAADAYLSFDPAYLRVVDAGGNETNRIVPGSALPLVLQNRADNSLGRIAFSAGRALGGPPTSGDFALATVRFKAMVSTGAGGTPVRFLPGTNLFSEGNPILQSAHDGLVIAGSSTLRGRVSLQGRGAPPSSRWEGYPVRVTLYPPGSNTPLSSFQITVDNSGQFAVGSLNPGTYDVAIKNAHSLSNRRGNVTVPGGTAPLNFGTLREGDASNNDRVAGEDFSILAHAYATSPGQPEWDARTDFNGDEVINGGDFSLLATHYGLQGPIPITITLSAWGEVTPVGAVNIYIDPPSQTVAFSQVFTADIAIQAGSQPVDVVDAYLTFDRNYLRVVDQAGNEATSILPGDVLPLVLRNTADNSLGRIIFSAGRQFGAPPPSGDFILATIRFKAIAETNTGSTLVDFTGDTAIFWQGSSVLGTQTGGTIVIGPYLRHRLYMPTVVK